MIFDTVHASSTSWPHREWQRLVNVGISRARDLLVVVSSRDEMREPYLSPLATLLAPRVLQRGVWRVVQAHVRHVPSERLRRDPATLGAQLEERTRLRAVPSAEQERLARLRLDGGPRLVRGVAGSGKTFLLAAWLAQAVRSATPPRSGTPRASSHERFWILYGNRSLGHLIVDLVETQWRRLESSRAFPWDYVDLWHVPDWLQFLASRFSITLTDLDRYAIEARAERLLETLRRRRVAPLATAAFVDEAQDLGPSVLELCAFLLPARSPAQPTHRPIHILYDNAQNIYGRGTPRWSSLGLDMRGRSAVLDQSFRGTRPIAEFALNVLDRLEDLSPDPDHAERVARGQIVSDRIHTRSWWRADFAQAHGPTPSVRIFDTLTAELSALTEILVHWIGREGVAPSRIPILANGTPFRVQLIHQLRPALESLSVIVREQRSGTFSEAEDTLVVTTAHSFKGYEAEIICVPGVDGFVTRQGRVLARPLYSALTRARSLLYVSGSRRSEESVRHLIDVIESVARDLTLASRSVGFE